MRKLFDPGYCRVISYFLIDSRLCRVISYFLIDSGLCRVISKARELKLESRSLVHGQNVNKSMRTHLNTVCENRPLRYICNGFSVFVQISCSLDGEEDVNEVCRSNLIFIERPPIFREGDGDSEAEKKRRR